MSQDVIRSYSNIVLTSGNNFVLSQAAAQGAVAARNGLDAARLVLNPLSSLTVNALVIGTPALDEKARRSVAVRKSTSAATAFSSPQPRPTQHWPTPSISRQRALNNLNAESLLIGAIRTDNTDGTTSLAITGRSIVVNNDATHPLKGPEIVFAVDDGVTDQVAAELTLHDGATIIATGTVNDQRSGAYIIDGRVTFDTNAYRQRPTLRPAHWCASPTGRSVWCSGCVPHLIRYCPVRQARRLVPMRRSPSATSRWKAVPSASTHRTRSRSARRRSFAARTSHSARRRWLSPRARRLRTSIVITPELQAILSQGDQLTLHSQSFIGFDNGSYQFKSIALDAATLESLQGAESPFRPTTTSTSATQAKRESRRPGTGTLSFVAGQIGFGSGKMATSGFGGGVRLTARDGMFSGRTPSIPASRRRHVHMPRRSPSPT